MPGGGGGGKASPPNMRLVRRPGIKTVCYEEPASFRWYAGVVFTGGLFALALVVIAASSWELGRLLLGPLGPLPGWVVPVAAAAGVALRFALLSREELLLEPSRRRVLRRDLRPWRGAAEEEFAAPPVEAVALLKKHRGRDYLLLRLVLDDGTTRFLDEGEELARMRELAGDVRSALAVPLVEADGLKDHLSEATLTLLPDAAGVRRWVDLEYPARRAALWVLFIVSLVFAVGGTWVIGWELAAGRLTLSWPEVLGEALAALVLSGAALVCVVHGVHLLRRRRVAVRAAWQEGTVTLLRPPWFGARPVTLTAAEVAAVVAFVTGKGECRRVWLETHAGRRLFVDGGHPAVVLGHLAADLARCLRVPVRHEPVRWYSV
jgi:hypothetical protein